MGALVTRIWHGTHDQQVESWCRKLDGKLFVKLALATLGHFERKIWLLLILTSGHTTSENETSIKRVGKKSPNSVLVKRSHLKPVPSLGQIRHNNNKKTQ